MVLVLMVCTPGSSLVETKVQVLVLALVDDMVQGEERGELRAWATLLSAVTWPERQVYTVEELVSAQFSAASEYRMPVSVGGYAGSEAARCAPLTSMGWAGSTSHQNRHRRLHIPLCSIRPLPVDPQLPLPTGSTFLAAS